MPNTYWDTAKIIDQLVSGRTSGIVDDFEDNDLSEYSSIEGGNTATQSNVVHDGTYAIRTEEPSNSTRGYAGSTSGLPRYPQAGDTFQYWVRTEQGNTARAGFGLQDDTKDDGYDILFSDSKIEIRRFDSGVYTTLSKTNVSTSAATWYRHVVKWEESGNITATLYDESGSKLASISATDTNFSEGGISFSGKGLDGHKWYFDTFEITEVTAPTGVIDGFEDGDVAEYTEELASTFTAATDTVHSGTYAGKIEGDVDGLPSNGRWYSNSGLPRYPEAGDVFEWWFYLNQSGDHAIIGWCMESEGRGDNYQIAALNDSAEVGNSRFEIKKYSGGSATILTEESDVGINTGAWYRVNVDHASGGDITATLYDSNGTQLSQISATDSEYTTGGIYWNVYNNDNEPAIAWFDDAEII
jgi:hypothetical protein